MAQTRKKDSYKKPARSNTKTASRARFKKLTEPTLPSKVLVSLIIVAGVALLLVMFVGMFGNTKAKVSSDSYQVVFLNDRQVYFGKLSNINEPYVTLTDVHQINTPVEGEESDFSVSKNSEQFYGPEDTLYISRDKIVSWNNLKTDSQVVEAISTLKQQ